MGRGVGGPGAGDGQVGELRERSMESSYRQQPDTDKTDKEGELVALDYDTDTSKGERAVKVILLGDSAVGKSKLKKPNNPNRIRR